MKRRVLLLAVTLAAYSNSQLTRDEAKNQFGCR